MRAQGISLPQPVYWEWMTVRCHKTPGGLCIFNVHAHPMTSTNMYTPPGQSLNKAYALPILQTLPHPLLQQPATLYSHCKTFCTSLGIPIFVMWSHKYWNNHKCIITFQLRIQYLHVYYIWYFCIDWAYSPHIFRIDLFDPSSLQEWAFIMQ